VEGRAETGCRVPGYVVGPAADERRWGAVVLPLVHRGKGVGYCVVVEGRVGAWMVDGRDRM
jgi:hypothetical protein